ncbi:MAG: hypothetical protein KDB01_06710 [Planctomycetaceae bacterium]|nr:hypothetical protein [Planctomycetaceae bacterium]
MKYILKPSLFLSVAGSLLLLTSIATGQDRGAQSLPDTTGSIGAVVGPTDDNESDPLLSGVSRSENQNDLSDPTFERHVNPGLIGLALSSGDTVLLADVALQWTEAEHVLNRLHRSGVTARFLVEKAARLAAKTGDKATLARLARASELTKHADLASQIAAIEKLDRNSRVTEPEWTIDVNGVDSETFGRIRQIRDDIQSAALTSDLVRLRNIASELKTASLPDAAATHLSSLVGQAIESVDTDAAPADDAVRMLIGQTRGICGKCSGTGRYVRGLSIVRCDRCDGHGSLPDNDGGYVSGWAMESSTGSSEGNIQTDSQVKRRFQFTLWNGCDNAVIHFRLGKIRTEQLAPGAKKSYSFTGNASDATLYIFNNKKQYNLKSGNHKFWWMKSGQVGFDMNNF